MKKLSLGLNLNNGMATLNQFKRTSIAASGISKGGEGWYPNFRHTKDIHIPLVMLPSSSSGHSLISPTLSYSKPFQWKGD